MTRGLSIRLAVLFTVLCGGACLPVASAQQGSSGSRPSPNAHPDDFHLMIGDGKLCTSTPAAPLLSGNEKLCLTFRRAELKLASPQTPDLKSVVFHMTYHPPGPVTDDGELVWRNETDVQLDCRKKSMRMMHVRTYGRDGALVQEEMSGAAGLDLPLRADWFPKLCG